MRKIKGTKKADVLVAGSDHTHIDGKAGDDTIKGGSGKDTLIGGAGNDHIFFGLGRDKVTGGTGDDTFHFMLPPGTGKTTFGFKNVSSGWVSSKLKDPSVITDFGDGDDKIDLSSIDANKKVRGDQEFKFLGTNGFTKHAGELIYQKVDLAGTAKDKTMIFGDMNGDGKADFQIELTGLKTLDTGDFIL